MHNIHSNGDLALAATLPFTPATPTTRWNHPPGNLVAVYIEACERHKVPANSAVISQLQRRVRLMQAGPWQRVAPSGPEADALLGATGVSAFSNHLGSPRSRLGAAAAAAGDPLLAQQSSYLSAASATAAEALSRPRTALTSAATTQVRVETLRAARVARSWAVKVRGAAIRAWQRL